MRLLLFSTEFPPGPGGIGTHAYQLAHQLTRLGWQVLVLSPQDYASNEEIKAFNQAQPFGVARLRHLPGAPFEAVYRLALLFIVVSREQPDVILASGERAAWLTALFTRYKSLPWSAMFHGVLHAKNWERSLTRWAFHHADTVISVSEYSQLRLRDLGIYSEKEVVIPNGADDDTFHTLEEQEVRDFCSLLGISGSHILLTVGSVTERKGQDVVIRALPHILAEFPDTVYLIAGLPKRQELLADLAESLGVSGHVHFLGRVDTPTLLKAYNACDVFVMTSRHSQDGEFEGYGIAVLEAALCGKPAVVTKNSGLAEAVAEGQTGLLVPEEDPQATARAILKLLHDRSLRSQLGRCARERALSEQTWSKRVVIYDRLLQQLVTDSENRNRLPNTTHQERTL